MRDAAPSDAISTARAVRIEDEIARRGINRSQDYGARGAGPGDRRPALGVFALARHDRQNGVALRDDAGKNKYANAFTFDSKEVRDAFSAAAIDAVLKFAPGAFEREEAR